MTGASDKKRRADESERGRRRNMRGSSYGRKRPWCLEEVVRRADERERGRRRG